jgi:chromosomal replication initiator protein
MNQPDRQLWDGMLAHLREHHAPTYRHWFSELEPLGVAEGAFGLRAGTDNHRDYLQRSCSKHFNDAALAVSGRLLPVRFIGPHDPAPQVASTGKKGGKTAPRPSAAIHTTEHVIGEPPLREVSAEAPSEFVESRGKSLESGFIEPSPRSAPIRDHGLVINPDYGFENFVQGPSNRLAHAAAVAVARKPGRTYNPLFLHGGVGLGKTHLLQAICLTIREAEPGASIYYTSCDGFITQFMDAVQAGQMGDFRHRFRDLDVLVIDDIHFLAKRERTQEEFFHTFNSLYQMNKQIVLSSDAAPEEIPDLEDRLVSRFKSGLVAKMDTPDYESRVAIVKTKGKLRGIHLTPDVAEFIASRIDTNIRELEGTIVTLHMRSAVEGRPLNIELAREALADRGEQEQTDLSIQTILEAVAAFYRVRPAELMSKRRHRSVAIPRQVCMFLARRHTRHSLEEVGLTFGGRDHTTVMHAVRMIESRLLQDEDLNTVIRSIEDKLRVTKTA